MTNFETASSINLSASSLSNEYLCEHLFESLSHTDVPAEKICLEITETAAIMNLSRAMTFMERLKTCGCSFALDDFGSGFSSFAYLKNLPVDYLKIDGQFVKDIAEDPVDLAMVRAINEVGQVMAKQTIAEFVESEDILDRLKEVGVDFAQGYHLGRPRPLAADP
jgi:Amt family ammonium transporter